MYALWKILRSRIFDTVRDHGSDPLIIHQNWELLLATIHTRWCSSSVLIYSITLQNPYLYSMLPLLKIITKSERVCGDTADKLRNRITWYVSFFLIFRVTSHPKICSTRREDSIIADDTTEVRDAGIDPACMWLPTDGWNQNSNIYTNGWSKWNRNFKRLRMTSLIIRAAPKLAS